MTVLTNQQAIGFIPENQTIRALLRPFSTISTLPRVIMTPLLELVRTSNIAENNPNFTEQ